MQKKNRVAAASKPFRLLYELFVGDKNSFPLEKFKEDFQVFSGFACCYKKGKRRERQKGEGKGKDKKKIEWQVDNSRRYQSLLRHWVADALG